MREKSISENDEHLIAYLLGELPEAENARIEEEYLGFDASLAPLVAMEAELYDAYARDTLSPARRRLFEQRFLVTPEQRWQLAFSRTLLRVPRSSATSQRASWMRIPWPRLAATVAAVVLIAIMLWWPVTKTPQQQIPQIAQQQPAIRPQVIIPFELGSGITRDSGEEPTLDIPPNADLIRVTAKADHDAPPLFGAVLRKPEGTEIWRNDAQNHASDDARSFVVEIPVAPLTPGHYILTLYSQNRNGAPEEIADYAFRVRKP